MTATDQAANRSIAAVHFTIQTNANEPPVAVDAAVQTAEDTPLAIVLEASDPEHVALVYTVTPPVNGGVTGVAPNLTYTPNPDFYGTDAVTFTVSDGVDPPVSAVVSITVTPVNDQPVAITGPDQTVSESALVTLDGSASVDVESPQLTYRWTQVSGPAVTLGLSDPRRPTFIAPPVPVAGATLSFSLIVNDGQLDSALAPANVFVKNVNRTPIADAGPDQRVKTSSLVTLNGSASFDPDGESLSYQWTQTSGPSVQLSNPLVARPTFIAPIVDIAGASLIFRLAVSDGIDGATDTVTIAVENVNHRPIANAGPDQIKNEKTLVTLNGTASTDPDGDRITFRWKQVSGPGVRLSSSTDKTPTFMAPRLDGHGDDDDDHHDHDHDDDYGGRETRHYDRGDDGRDDDHKDKKTLTLVFRLVVNDGQLDSAPDDVVITITKANAPPSCATARPSDEVLWPPNHKLVSMEILGVSDPNGDHVKVKVTKVTQDEPVNGNGDGDTSPDAFIQNFGTGLLIRAERAGNRNGRAIKIYFTADDGRGASCDGWVKVGVPVNHSNGKVVDDGQRYDATKK